ncbi:MAG: BrnA antitoxin family protein [Chloroflexota bacterium]|nr:BrnA antitoxin family protein [Chloroflexota bacterium]MDQ6906813.1 BrnA antitoxin family protein [Chloroflexota bacterium]
MKAIQTETKNRIPDFATIEEMAEFWDTHDASEYQDELEPVEFEIAKPLKSTWMLSIRLDKETFDALQAIAKPKGLGASTLARMWILEELERVRKNGEETR